MHVGLRAVHFALVYGDPYFRWGVNRDRGWRGNAFVEGALAVFYAEIVVAWLVTYCVELNGCNKLPAASELNALGMLAIKFRKLVLFIQLFLFLFLRLCMSDQH